MNPKGNLAKLVQKLKKLNNQKVDLGYFEEQGLHSSGDSYVEIMKVHELGEYGMPARPVLGNVSILIDRDFERSTGALWTFINSLVHTPSSSISDELDKLGSVYAHYSERIFGNPAYLTVTFNPEPLVDTGELAENFAWRTTLNMTYKTVG